MATKTPNKQTFRALLTELQKLTDEQLDRDISIYDPSIDEMFEADLPLITITDDSNKGSGTFDDGHPYLTIFHEPHL